MKDWYLIDDSGWHRIKVSSKGWDFFSNFRGEQDAEDSWPAFTQFVVRAELDDVIDAIGRVADRADLTCQDVSTRPEFWDEGVCLATSGELVLVGEPGVDLAERFIGADTCEALAEELEAEAAYVAHDPSTGSLFLTRYRGGGFEFIWEDSIEPGPSVALEFNDDGSATREDPRTFALRKLGYPESSPFLNRHEFVTSMLDELGLDRLQPNLGDLPVEACVCVRQDPQLRLA